MHQLQLLKPLRLIMLAKLRLDGSRHTVRSAEPLEVVRR